jgi:hypothetical protein
MAHSGRDARAWRSTRATARTAFSPRSSSTPTRASPSAPYSDETILRIVSDRDFGWEDRSRGRTRRPPLSLYTMVPRTGGYTRTTLGFEICPSFKGLSLSRRAEPLSYDSLPFSSLYLARMLPSPLTSTSSHRCRWCLSGSWRPALSFMLRVALRCSIVLASGAP